MTEASVEAAAAPSTAGPAGAWTLLAGGAIALAGLLVPAPALLAALGAELHERQLLLGARLFKALVVVLGVVVGGLGRLPIWHAASPPRHRLDLGPAPPLVALLAAAFALRAWDLGAGLWYDEIVTYVTYTRMSIGEILTTYISESQHFLFTALARVSVGLFGEHTWALRLPAVVFGVGSIWALYLLARRVTGASEALLSAALLTFSYHHIWFSQNARGYTGLLLWTLLASWLLLRALDERRAELWVLYAVATALGVYTHTTMLFVVVGHVVVCGLHLLARRPEGAALAWGGPALGFGLAGLLTLLLHALVLPQMLGAVGQTSKVPEWRSPFWTFLELVRGLRIELSSGVAVAAAGAVFGAGLVSFGRSAPAVVALLVVPAAAGAAVVTAVGHPLWPRFFFFVLGFAVLVVVRGCLTVGAFLARRLRSRALSPTMAGVAVALGLIAVSAASVPRAYAPKQDYAGALEFVERERRPGDAIVTVGLATFPYRSFFKVDWAAADTAEALAAIRKGAARTWLVYTISLHLRDEHPDIMRSIERDFTVVKRFTGSLGGGTIVVCRADRPLAPSGS